MGWVSSLLLLWLKVNVEDTVEMLPKSRRALTIQEIAALARSSLHGNTWGHVWVCGRGAVFGGHRERPGEGAHRDREGL